MRWTLIIIFFLSYVVNAQKTTITGTVVEYTTGKPIPFAKVFYKNSKIGTETNLDGYYEIDSYYSTDSLIIRASGFESQTVSIVKDISQVINIRMKTILQTTEEIVIRAPDVKPSTRLFRRVVKNKPVNNKAKLSAYEYETYNKIQLDLNNINDKFKESIIVQNLKVVMNYLDTLEGHTYLPLILSESLSDFYYRTHPTKKKEIIKASRITGIDNLQLNQFLGDMYQNINVYDDYIHIFDKSFVSPIADFAMSIYKFRLQDSMFIDNHWCYLLTFQPKHKGVLAFKGEMWINDTTYAVKKWTAGISNTANINYVNGFYLEQDFEEVKPEVWMLQSDKLIVNLQVTRSSESLSFIGRKITTKTDFIINTPHPVSFYNTKNNVKVLDSATSRSSSYWRKHRHIPLNDEEEHIDEMLDSLNHLPLFKFFKNITILATTGFYPAGMVEVGDIRGLVGYNQIEGFRNQLCLRTSNKFSKRIELTGKIAYGYKDHRVKYGGKIRLNVTPEKRGMLKLYYDYDTQQWGLGQNATNVEASIGSLLKTRPLKMLTMVEKFGGQFKKDINKSFILTAGAAWKSLSPLGRLKYKVPTSSISYQYADNIRTFETYFAIRFAKNESYISGTFDRISVGAKSPIITLRGTLGIKGVLGSNYEYQKLELSMQGKSKLGIMGELFYNIYGGIYFGKVAFPFLKVHEGSRSYWFQENAYNRMDYYEFISDRYIGASIAQHFNGFFLDRVPLVRRLKWRLVVSAKGVWGQLSNKQKSVMLLPENTKSFGVIPYVEAAIGIENIFRVLRIDAVWRITHRPPSMPPVAIRGKISIRF